MTGVQTCALPILIGQCYGQSLPVQESRVVESVGCGGYFLYLAQKSIPIGTAYVIWTGIGAIGTVLLGILFFHDSANIFRLLFLSLILIGIVGLKLVH